MDLSWISITNAVIEIGSFIADKDKPAKQKTFSGVIAVSAQPKGGRAAAVGASFPGRSGRIFQPTPAAARPRVGVDGKGGGKGRRGDGDKP